MIHHLNSSAARQLAEFGHTGAFGISTATTEMTAAAIATLMGEEACIEAAFASHPIVHACEDRFLVCKFHCETSHTHKADVVSRVVKILAVCIKSCDFSGSANHTWPCDNNPCLDEFGEEYCCAGHVLKTREDGSSTYCEEENVRYM